MPTALIAEDEPLLAEALKADLRQHWPDLQIVATACDGLSAARLALQHQPDVCFLDIRMPGATGLEAAQMLAEDWPAGDAAAPFPLLVFVTAYDQYAVQAFEAQAADYLLKPVQAPRLVACVGRLQQRLAERQAAAAEEADAQGAVAGAALPAAGPDAALLAQVRARLAAAGQPGQPGQPDLARRSAAGASAGSACSPGGDDADTSPLTVIQASTGSTVHMVPIADVLYFEAADKYVRVVTAEGEHLIRTSLRELLPRLDAGTFWQVHRSLVVRAAAVATATREDSGKVTLTLRGRSDKLTASRLYAHLFKGM